MAATESYAERSTGRRRTFLSEVDWMMAAVVSLCCLGMAMAVSIQGVTDGGPLLAMKSQAGKLLVGLFAFLIAALVPLDKLRRIALPAFVAFLVLCFWVAIFERDTKGASRWLRIGSFSLQPVEPARFLLLIVAARLLADAGAAVHRFRTGFLPVMCAAAALAAPLLLQPDVGNAVFSVTLVAVLALVAGVRFRWFALLAVPGVVLIVVSMLHHDHVSTRLAAFFSGKHPDQVAHSITAIGSGGWLGTGLGNGWMKMGFVPEPKNDFVFAMLGEELGLLGSFVVLALYTTFGWAGMKLALRVEDPFRRLVVVGFTLAICLQALINLFVVTGLGPAKGIDLPFVSSGGTGLAMAMAGVGIIGNAARSDRSGGATRYELASRHRAPSSRNSRDL